MTAAITTEPTALGQGTDATPSLALVGVGALHDALARRLGRMLKAPVPAAPSAQAGPPPAAALVLVAADARAPAESLWTDASRRVVAWLPVQGEIDRIVIGPVVRPGIAGCVRCLDRRRASAARDLEARAALEAAHGAALARVCSLLLAPAADLAAAIAVDEVCAWAGGATLRTDRAAIMIDLGTLNVGVHRFLPDPSCPACGGLPGDDPAAAVVRPRSRPKLSLATPRTRDLGALEAGLIDEYVDDEAGLLTSVRSVADFALPVVSTHLRVPGATIAEEGYGRTLDFRGARLTAIAEALERMGGGRPGGKRSNLRGTYRELGERALDPRTLGLYPEERYAIPGFPYRRYHDDLELTWVWAYSFARAEPVLVPEQYAYYRLNQRVGGEAAEPPFVYEISNGCALGSCIEEAIIHGLVEVAERDAFLMTWLARMAVPRLDPASARDPRVALVIERIKHRAGYQVLIFCNTLEQGIPSFWVMAIDESGDPVRPRAMCAAGSALDPERGVINALQELTTSIDWRVATYARERDRASAMVANPSLVRTMADHALLYSHEAAFDRFAFLLDGAKRSLSFAELRETWRWPEHADLRDDLVEIVGRFQRSGLDVIVVDQTTPEHRSRGFSCVKTIVPGALPMTFGHDARRVDGLPRVFDVPRQLGYHSRRLTPAAINSHPHPFP